MGRPFVMLLICPVRKASLSRPRFLVLGADGFRRFLGLVRRLVLLGFRAGFLLGHVSSPWFGPARGHREGSRRGQTTRRGGKDAWSFPGLAVKDRSLSFKRFVVLFNHGLGRVFRNVGERALRLSAAGFRTGRNGCGHLCLPSGCDLGRQRNRRAAGSDRNRRLRGKLPVGARKTTGSGCGTCQGRIQGAQP